MRNKYCFSVLNPPCKIMYQDTIAEKRFLFIQAFSFLRNRNYKWPTGIYQGETSFLFDKINMVKNNIQAVTVMPVLLFTFLSKYYYHQVSAELYHRFGRSIWSIFKIVVVFVCGAGVKRVRQVVNNL